MCLGKARFRGNFGKIALQFHGGAQRDDTLFVSVPNLIRVTTQTVPCNLLVRINMNSSYENGDYIKIQAKAARIED